MNELADRIVARGVGWKSPEIHSQHRPYRLYDPRWKKNTWMTAEQFTHSWEVAGALEDKCIENGWRASAGKTGKYRKPGDDYICRIENFMSTETLACCYSDELIIAKVKAFVEVLEAT